MKELVVTRLTLFNYRSWASQTILFDQITPIIPKEGAFPNQIGKTNILRALKTILYHDEFPDTAIRYGENEAYIEVELGNKYVIKREWKNKKQFVYITSPEGKTDGYTSVKAAAKPVRDIIGIYKVALDSFSDPEDFNFLPVRSKLLFLDDRQDILLKRLSSVFGMNVLEEVTIGIGKDIRAKEDQVRAKQRDLEIISKKIVAKENIVLNIAKELKKLRLIEETNKSVEAKLQKLQDIKKHNSANYSKFKVDFDLEKYKSKVSCLTKLISFKENSEQLNSLYSNIHISKQKLQKLEKDKQTILKSVCKYCGK
jgi:hypothetical protein